MKPSRLSFRLICIILILISCFGLFEQSAFDFLKSLAKNNTEYLAIVTEVKMIIAGLSSLQVPFVSGHTEGIDTSLGKVQNYLLFTDVITFLQVLFLALSKSILFKIFLIGLFVLTFVEKRRRYFSKLLIICLALSPGISIYTVTVKHLSHAVQMDFGEAYLKDLKVSTDKIRQENIKLMEQHDQEITKINNGQKGVKLFQKLKEDISYDLKKAKTAIEGDFSEMRTLMKSGGHAILEKVFRFCTMILFCLFILPLGYVLIIRLLLKNLYGNMALEGILDKMPKYNVQQLKQEVKDKSFFQKLKNIGKVMRKEFIKVEEEVERSQEFQDLQHKMEQLEETIKTDVEKRISQTEVQLKSTAQKVEGEVKDEVQKKMKEGELFVKEKADNVETKVQQDVSSDENKLKGDAQKVTTKLKDKVDSFKLDIQDDVSSVKDDVQTDITEGKDKVDTIKSDVQTDVSTAEDEVQDNVHTADTDTQNKIDSIESGIQGEVAELDNKAKADAIDMKNKANEDEEFAKDKLDQSTSTAKDDVSETVNKVKDTEQRVQKTKPKINL